MRRSSQRGLTVFGLIIVIAAALVVVIASVGLTRCTSSGAEAAEEARRFAKDLGMGVQGVTCTDRDSDGDGYVSCTVSTTDGKFVPIECARRVSFNSGCKMQQLVIPPGQRGRIEGQN